jgi:DNA polymerase epsilon subunit 1
MQNRRDWNSLGNRYEENREQLRLQGDDIDANFGFGRLYDGPSRLGWLLNYLPITMPNEMGVEKSGLDLYFLTREGGSFKATLFHEPYFLVDCKDSRHLPELIHHLHQRLEGCRAEQIEKKDLDLPNHLAGLTHTFLKLSFSTVNELVEARNTIRPIVEAHQRNVKEELYHQVEADYIHSLSSKVDPITYISEVREYDM